MTKMGQPSDEELFLLAHAMVKEVLEKLRH